jgi:glycosyltransferase involved in cell wall biosynthesis
MKILSIGLDKKILDKNSKNFQRQKEYSSLVNELHIIVFGPGRETRSNNLFIYGTEGRNRIIRFLNAYKITKKILKNKDLRDWLITTQDPFFSGFLGYLLKIKFSAFKGGSASGGKISLHVQVHTDFLSKYFRQESLYNLLQYFLGKFIIKKADGFRVVSRRIKESLIRLGISKDKITVVPIYVEIKSPAEGEARSGRQKLKVKSQSHNNKFIFLTVGRLVPVKNIELQIKAMAEILKKYPNTELWIVGDGPEKEKLQTTNYKLQTTKNIRFWGWQDNLERFYCQADVFLLTSNYEGWPQVVIQAAFFSLPILITNFSSAGEFIVNNKNGIIIPLNDSSSLKRAMLKLIENKKLRAKLGKNVKKAILGLPSKEETLKLYKKSWEMTIKK